MAGGICVGMTRLQNSLPISHDSHDGVEFVEKGGLKREKAGGEGEEIK